MDLMIQILICIALVFCVVSFSLKVCLLLQYSMFKSKERELGTAFLLQDFDMERGLIKKVEDNWGMIIFKIVLSAGLGISCLTIL